jgi:hypothetical protein
MCIWSIRKLCVEEAVGGGWDAKQVADGTEAPAAERSLTVARAEML